MRISETVSSPLSAPESTDLSMSRSHLLSARKPVAAILITPALSTVLGHTAAVVIVASGTVAAAVAGTIGAPLTVTKGPALGALSRVVRCQFVDSDTEPSPFDFPIPLSIGTSDFALYVGSGLATTLVLVVFPLSVTGLVFLAGSGTSKMLRVAQRKVLANAAMLTLGYFGPLTFKLPSLIAWHSRSATEVVIAVSCPLLVQTIVASLAFCVVRVVPTRVRVFQPSDGSDELEYENRVSESLFVETFGLLFDAARSMALIHRLLYFEDFAVAALLQVLEGIRPERSAACGITGTLMACVCIAHSLYLIVARPYGARIELVLAILGSLVISVTSLLAMGVALTGSSGENIGSGAQSSALLLAFGCGILICNLFFVLQATILGIVALAEAHKIRFKKQFRVDSQTRAGETAEARPRRIEVYVASPPILGDPTGTDEGFPLLHQEGKSLHVPLLQSCTSPSAGNHEVSENPVGCGFRGISNTNPLLDSLQEERLR
jgi:hypothetical protein